MFNQFEKKLEEEQMFRLRNEEELRKFFETKLIGVVEKVKNEERTNIEREKRIMQQF